MVRVMALLQGSTPYDGAHVWISSAGKMGLSTAGGPMHFSATSFPTDRWACLELHVHADSTDGVIQLSIDGDALTDILFTGDTQPSPTYGIWSIGMFFPSLPSGTYSIWFDEVMVDDQPIGCTR